MKTDKNIVAKHRFGNRDWNANHIWPLDVDIALCASRDLSRDLGVERRVYIKSRICPCDSVWLRPLSKKQLIQ